MCLMTTKGLGHHIWTLSADDLKHYYMVRRNCFSLSVFSPLLWWKQPR